MFTRHTPLIDISAPISSFWTYTKDRPSIQNVAGKKTGVRSCK